jgi:Response regulator containing CheY-like receiver domain and AraC-type DNA-binding domain
MNILLVEDEPPILRDIQYIIESYQEDYTIYATAHDGQSAIDLLEQNVGNIDVLITDIHIPIVDGLELIGYVRKQMPHIYCIIISGYSEFEYAKKAVQLKVVDYLLKPINEDELNILLKQIYTKWCMDYFHGEKLSPTNANTDKESTSPYAYGLAILCTGSIPVSSTFSASSDQDKWKTDNLQNKLETLLNSQSEVFHRFYIMDGITPQEKNVLFVYRRDCVIDEQIFELAFQDILKQTYTITITVHYSINSLNGIKKRLESVHLFLMEHILIGKPQILIYKQEATLLSSYDNSGFSNDLSRLLKLFSDLNITLFDTELQQCLRKMEDNCLPQVQVAKYLHTLIDMCISQYQNIEGIYNISSNELVWQCIYQADTYSMLFQNLQSIFHNIFSCIIAETPVTENRKNILSHIDQYIRKNCYEQINTKSIAEKYGFTPAYLSKIFQDYKNISPMDYILQLRIEKAMELFQCNPELMIKDVAAHIGYPDSLYFSKVFKKYTGLSPKQYIRKVRGI